MKKKINFLAVLWGGATFILSALLFSGCIGTTSNSGGSGISEFNLKEIKITSQPAKTFYNVGEELDTSGMVVTAVYEDYKSGEVTGWTTSGFDSSSQGTKTVTVSYTERGVTKTADFTVSVIDSSKTKTPEGFVLIKGGTAEEVSVSSPYYIAETELTYSKWKEVYDWATNTERGDNKYTFQNIGSGNSVGDGNNEVPVSKISWRDAVIWCNAASEKDNLSPVYVKSSSDKTPVRVAEKGRSGVGISGDTGYTGTDTNNDTSQTSGGYGSAEKAYVDTSANGYRLPTKAEWEFAARGGDPSSPEWDYIWAGTNDESSLADYAVYKGSHAKASVKSKKPNSANLYDMSGNVYEWVYDKVTFGSNASNLRSVYGGDFNSEASECGVSSSVDVDLYRNDGAALSSGSNSSKGEIGFRLVRSLILE